MRNKKEADKIEINISNRIFYSVLFLIAIILFGVGVYAFNYPGPPSVMGHTMGELQPPSGSGFVAFSSGAWVYTANLPPTCTGYRDTLKYDATTRLWTCGPVGFSCNWEGWSPDFISYPSLTEDCYYIDTCSDINDCSTELCPYRLDGMAMYPPEEWQTYANPVLQTECTSGDVSQVRYASVCPTDATSACGYSDMSG